MEFLKNLFKIGGTQPAQNATTTTNNPQQPVNTSASPEQVAQQAAQNRNQGEQMAQANPAATAQAPDSKEKALIDTINGMISSLENVAKGIASLGTQLLGLQRQQKSNNTTAAPVAQPQVAPVTAAPVSTTATNSQQTANPNPLATTTADTAPSQEEINAVNELLNQIMMQAAQEQPAAGQAAAAPQNNIVPAANPPVPAAQVITPTTVA